MNEITIEAKTVAQAIEQGLKEMRLRRDQVEVSVVQEPSSGILGFGARPARVILREKLWGAETKAAEPREFPEMPKQETAPEPPRERERRRPEERAPKTAHGPKPPREGGEARRNREPGGMRGPRHPREHREYRERPGAVNHEPRQPHVPNVPQTQNKESDEVKTVLRELLGVMQFGEANILSGWDESQGRVRAEIVSPNSHNLIGRDGSVLEALQFLTTLIVNRRLKTQIAVQVDVEGYWKRLEEKAVAQAQRGAEEVKRTGHDFRLEPMRSSLRRLVHKTFEEHPDIVTVSEGEGAWRKVILKPKKK